jgi:transcription antitermination factor NusG
VSEQFNQTTELTEAPFLSSVISCKKEWYAVRTMSRHEKKVAAQLDHKGINAYLPLIPQRRCWTDRQKLVLFPLFPGYVFVYISSFSQSRLDVLRSPGVVSFVTQAGGPTPIPCEQIDSVRAMLAAKQPYLTHTYLKDGTKVRIQGGSLHGVEGILVSQNSSRMLVVSIDAIGKSLALGIQGYEYEVVQ